MVHDVRYYDYNRRKRSKHHLPQCHKLGTVLHLLTQERNYKVELYIASATNSHLDAPFRFQLKMGGQNHSIYLLAAHQAIVSKTFLWHHKNCLRADNTILTKTNIDDILYWKLAVTIDC